MSENVANKSVFSIAKLVALVPVLPPQKMWEHFCDVALHVWPFSMMFLSFFETKKHHLQNSSSIINFPVFFTKCSSKLFNALADENSASAIRNLWQMVLKAIWILARWRLAASGLYCNNSSTLNNPQQMTTMSQLLWELQRVSLTLTTNILRGVIRDLTLGTKVY